MILVIEPICHDSEHVPVNTSILEIIGYAYPEESLIFYGESNHVANIQGMISRKIKSEITWKKIRIPERHDRFFKRIIWDVKIIHNIREEIENTGKNIKIFFASANPSIIWAIKILTHFNLRHCQIQIVLHGGLASINGWRSRNPFVRIQDQLSALSFLNWKNIQYIVLEKSIKDRLLKSVPKLSGKVRILEHPFPESQNFSNIQDFRNPIKFGYLGVAIERKGFSQFLNTACIIKKKFPEETEFHAIGRLHGEYRGKNLPGLALLTTKPSEKGLSREEFNAKLKPMHFVCCFFDEKYYRYSASGVLLDAIAFEKPIICSKLQIFEDLSHEFDDIGYLCGNQTYADTIQKIIESNDSDRYRQQVFNIKKLKNTRSPRGLAPKYRNLTDVK